MKVKAITVTVWRSDKQSESGEIDVPDGWGLLSAQWTPSDPKYMSSEIIAGSWALVLSKNE